MTDTQLLNGRRAPVEVTTVKRRSIQLPPELVIEKPKPEPAPKKAKPAPAPKKAKPAPAPKKAKPGPPTRKRKVRKGKGKAIYTPEQEAAIRAELERQSAAERAKATMGSSCTITWSDWRDGGFESRY